MSPSLQGWAPDAGMHATRRTCCATATLRELNTPVGGVSAEDCIGKRNREQITTCYVLWVLGMQGDPHIASIAARRASKALRNPGQVCPGTAKARRGDRACMHPSPGQRGVTACDMYGPGAAVHASGAIPAHTVARQLSGRSDTFFHATASPLHSFVYLLLVKSMSITASGPCTC